MNLDWILGPKKMPKIAEMKLSRCGLEFADISKNYDCGIGELRLRSNISLKSCGIAIAEVFPSSCGIAIADSKKICACPPLQLGHPLIRHCDTLTCTIWHCNNSTQKFFILWHSNPTGIRLSSHPQTVQFDHSKVGQNVGCDNPNRQSAQQKT